MGVITHCGVKYLEGQISDGNSALSDAEKFADELSEVVLALDQQVGRLFHSDVEFFGLEIFFPSHHDEELVCYFDIPLQLKL